MTEIDDVYLIHHSHTDFGFTHDQPIVWDLQRRFIHEAMDLAEADLGRDDPGAFRWNVEVTSPLLKWVETASETDIRRFQKLEREGRFEVTGMLANITPLYGPAQTIESLRPLATLREEYGFDISHAINCDVNGHNWPLVDALLDADVETFCMSINEHFGGSPLQRPMIFRWEGPSGRSVLASNGYHYATGYGVGIGRDAEEFRNRYWPQMEQHLDAIDYPLSILKVPCFHPFGDNASAYDAFPAFVREWNNRDEVTNGDLPRLHMATLSEWWTAVREEVDELPVYRGDWTDYWNFGSISSARETAINRNNRRRLLTTDAIESVLTSLDNGKPNRSPTRRSALGSRGRAWWDVHLYDEHTWGANVSVSNSESEETYSQWNQKSNYAYEGRSLSLMNRRDAIGELARRIQHDEGDAILVFNPLPWSRAVSGAISDEVVNPKNVPDDETSIRHFQDRDINREQSILPPRRLPPFGYDIVSDEELMEKEERSFTERAVVETERYRLQFDRQRGGIRSLYDKELDREWVDQSSEYPLAGFVHERVADRDHDSPRDLLFHYPEGIHNWHAGVSDVIEGTGWQSDWPAERSQPESVLSHRVYQTHLGYTIKQVIDVPQVKTDLSLEVSLPKTVDDIVVEARWEMDQETHPEATYLAFPFNIDDPSVRLDVGGQAVRPGEDQIPGTCHDYYTVQNWADLSDEKGGMTVACPINPMVQLGGFRFGDDRDSVPLERALLLGWVTNNYWHTNFRANQPGAVTARYHLRPHSAPFEESDAHRFGLEAEHWEPLTQTLAEGSAPNASLPASGSLLGLPEPPVLTLQIRPDAGNGDLFPRLEDFEDTTTILVLLRNASDEPQIATVRSGELNLRSAEIADTFGVSTHEEIDVEQGETEIELASRETAALRLRCQVR